MILYSLTCTERKSQYHYPRAVTTWFPSMVKAREANRAVKAQGTEGVVAQVTIDTTVPGLIKFLNSLPPQILAPGAHTKEHV